MTRSRTIARILALLRHAEADTAEGRSAARLASKLQRRHRVTEAEIQAARLATDDRQRVPLTFTEPWEVALAVIVAGGFGVRCMADPTAPAVLVGIGAGRAARHLEIIRIRVESRLAAAGGAAGVARLPADRFGWKAPAPTSLAASSIQEVFRRSLLGGRTLGDLHGSAAASVFRLACAVEMVSPLLRSERDRAAREQAEARRVPPAPPAPESPRSRTSEPTSASEPSAEADGQGQEPEQRQAAPEASPDEEMVQRAEAMRRQVEELIARALRVANERPAWIVDVPESGALAVM